MTSKCIIGLFVISASCAFAPAGFAQVDEAVVEPVADEIRADADDRRGGREQLRNRLDDVEATWRSADVGFGELLWDLRMYVDVVTQNNQDLRALKEDTDDAVRFSDDRHTDAYTRFSPALRYKPVEQVTLNLRLQTDLLWGTDLDVTTGGADRDDYLLSNFSLRELSLAYTPIDNDDVRLQFEIGRQPFEIGVVPNDYVLDYNIDAITGELDLGKFGRFRAVIFEIFGGSDPSDTLARVAYEADRQQFAGYRGKTNTYRSGLVYDWVNQDAVPGLGVAGYYFFTKVGASCQGSSEYTTGNDISYCGELGNFVDNDFVHNYGLRARYEYLYGEDERSHVSVYGEGGRSDGIDRKEPQQFDQQTDGWMFGGGASWLHSLNEGTNVHVGLDGYYFEGSQYASNGQRFEHGYVGMRGDRVGGLLMGTLSGWRPSATMNNFGIDNEPYDRFRIGGLAYAHLGLGTEFVNTMVNLDGYIYTDTNDSFVTNFPEGGTSDLPAGYAGDEVDAQRNLGEMLGIELNASIGHEFVDDMFRVFAEGGVFLPGDFYHYFRPPTVTNDDLVIGGGDDIGAGERPFWAFRLAVELDL